MASFKQNQGMGLKKSTPKQRLIIWNLLKEKSLTLTKVSKTEEQFEDLAIVFSECTQKFELSFRNSCDVYPIDFETFKLLIS